MTIHVRLKSERERLGLSQSKAGDIAAVTKQTFIQWEKGNSYPDAAQLQLLLKSGFDISYLITGVSMQYAVEPSNTNIISAQVYLSNREAALLDDFRSLSDAEKDAAETMLHAAAKSKKTKKA